MAKVDILTPFILSWEGGFVNNYLDYGGATNKGVTLKTWKLLGYDKDGDGYISVEDLKLITDKDVTDVILKPHYWDRWKADLISSQSIANLVVDWVWASGKYGITEVQKLLGVRADGIVGNITLGALNGQEPKYLFARIKKARVQYIENLIKRRPSQIVFKKGWLRRINGINYGSLTLNKVKDNLLTFKDI